MATFSKQAIISALERLGQLADAEGIKVELVVLGGAAMVVAYGARQSTHDVDVAILAPREAQVVRQLATVVADERGWPEDWLNDAAKGYLVGLSTGAATLIAPGIEVYIPSEPQLLAMKLAAWRDDVDVADARCLLENLAQAGDQETVWKQVERYLLPGRELKARYAFLDLWEQIHADKD